jgi:outer membrane receptor protein involved in Fe transport
MLAGALLAALSLGALDSPLDATAPSPDAGVDAAPSQGETIVTASREPRPAAQEGRAVNVITPEDLSRRPPPTTPLALRDEEGVFLQRTNTGGGAPIIRGLYGQQVLVMVDGVRLNNATTRAGPNQSLNTVDPFWVEQIEILRGTGSVLYGSDAIGGVVNVITPSPRFEQELAPVAEGRLLAGTADSSLQGHLRGGISLHDTALLAGFTGRNFNDVYAGARAGLERYTAYHEYDAAAVVRQRLAPGALVTLDYEAVRQADAPRTDLSYPGSFRMLSAQERDLAHARADLANVGPFRVQADVSAQRQAERLESFKVASNLIKRDDASVWSFGARVEASAAPQFGALGRLNLVLGADGAVDRVESGYSEGPLDGSGAFEAFPEQARYAEPCSQLSGGAFAFALAETPLATFRGGARAQLSRARLPNDDRLTSLFGAPASPAANVVTSGFAGELGVEREIGPWLTVLANATSGFRAPNLDDYLRLGPEGPGFIIPSRSLRPEQSYSGEVGFRAHGGDAAIQAFYAFTRIDGLVGGVPTTVGGAPTTPDGLPYLMRQNSDRAYLHAVDGAASLRLPANLALAATFSVVYSEQVRQGIREPLTRTPPPNGTVSLTYQPRDGLFVETDIRWAAPQHRLSEADRRDIRICPQVPGTCSGTPGFVALFVRGGWRIDSHLALTFAAQNLSNATYRYHGSGVDEPGLSVVLGAEGKL